jgi:large subunit GTPase 1
VGKSSTINALFGSKKTAVAATPGKTKHFQTLNVSDGLCLCDCPGLVMPRFARSKAEMVAAGVVPVDRLTDIRAPVAAVAGRVSREQFEKVYSIRLPRPLVNEAPDRPPTAPELLRSLAASRGWMGASALPDETRAGRRILKDFVDGKILHCTPPPNASPDILELADEISGRRHNTAGVTAPTTYEPRAAEGSASSGSDAGSGDGSGSSVPEGGDEEGNGAQAGPPSVSASALEAELDLELLAAMNVSGRKSNKPNRPEYKFHKKAARHKTRDGPETAVYDGAPLQQGKKGGLVRVTGYANA